MFEKCNVIDWPKLTKLLTGQLVHVANRRRHEKLWILIILTTITQQLHNSKGQHKTTMTTPEWGLSSLLPVKEEGSPQYRKSGRDSKIRWENVTRSNAPSPPGRRSSNYFYLYCDIQHGTGTKTQAIN